MAKIVGWSAKTGVAFAASPYLVVGTSGPDGPRTWLGRSQSPWAMIVRAPAALAALRRGDDAPRRTDLLIAALQVGVGWSLWLLGPWLLWSGVAQSGRDPRWWWAIPAAALRLALLRPGAATRRWHLAEHAALGRSRCGTRAARRAALVAAAAVAVGFGAGAALPSALFLDVVGLLLGSRLAPVEDGARADAEALEVAAAALSRLRRARNTDTPLPSPSTGGVAPMGQE